MVERLVAAASSWRTCALALGMVCALSACGRQVSQADLDALAEDMTKRLDQAKKELARANVDLASLKERLRQVEERKQGEAQARPALGDEIKVKHLVAEEATVGVLKIGALLLYDGKGVVRANLGMKPQDTVALALHDSRGVPRSVLAVLSQPDTAGLALFDPSGKQVAFLAGAAGGGASLSMSPDNNRVEGTHVSLTAQPHAPGAPTSVAFSVMRDGRPAVLIGWVEGAVGVQRAAFGNVLAYDLHRVGTLVGAIPQGK